MVHSSEDKEWLENLRQALDELKPSEEAQSISNLHYLWAQFTRIEPRTWHDIFESGKKFAKALWRLSGKEDPSEMAAFEKETGYCNDYNFATGLHSMCEADGKCTFGPKNLAGMKFTANQVQEILRLINLDARNNGLALMEFQLRLKETRRKSEENISRILTEIKTDMEQMYKDK